MQGSLSSSDRSQLFENIYCAVAYITMFPAAILLIFPRTVRNPRIRFHACQSILLNWILVSAGYLVGLIAGFEQLAGTGDGMQFKWALRIFTVAVLAIATMRVATGNSFRVPGIAAVAERQANGRIFALFTPVAEPVGAFAEGTQSLRDASVSTAM
jgi:uncharacterized membrane protein